MDSDLRHSKWPADSQKIKFNHLADIAKISKILFISIDIIYVTAYWP